MDFVELSCLIVRSLVPGTSGTKYPTVICSGAGKEFPRSRDAITYPHFSQVRIKQLSRLPDGRHALQLKGVARKRLAPGLILMAAGQAPHRSRIGYGISMRKIPAGKYSAVGGLFREHSLPGTLDVTEVAGGYRISSQFDLPLVVGGRYRLTPEEESGKRTMPLELLLCIPQEVDRQTKRLLRQVLSEAAQEISTIRIYALLFGLFGWIELPERLDSGRLADHLGSVSHLRFGRELIELSAEPRRRFLVAPELLEGIVSQVHREVRHGRAETVDTLASVIGHPPGLVEAITRRLEEEGELAREDGRYVAVGKEAGLSPMERGLVEQLAREAAGGNLGRGGKGADRATMRRLVRLQVVVELGDRYLPMESYSMLAGRLLHDKKPGGAISVSEARSALGLPREQTIRFLESLDDRGVLRRDGDVHRVVKGLEVE